MAEHDNEQFADDQVPETPPRALTPPPLAATTDRVDDDDDDDKPTCRLCFDQAVDPVNDPLLEPCKCSGSMALIHASCLFESRVNSFDPRSISECGICKTPYRTIDTQAPENGDAGGAQRALWLSIGRFLGHKLALFTAAVIALGFAPSLLCWMADLDEAPRLADNNVLNHLATGATSACACAGGWSMLKMTSTMGFYARLTHKAVGRSNWGSRLGGGGKKGVGDAVTLLALVGLAYLAYQVVVGVADLVFTARAASAAGLRSANRGVREGIARRFVVLNLKDSESYQPLCPEID